MGTNKEAKQAKSEFTESSASAKSYLDTAAKSAADAKASIADIKPTSEADAVNKGAYEDYVATREGDVSKLPVIAQYKQRAGAARQRAMTSTPLGDASLAARIANPTLIAESRELGDRAAEQQQASDVTGLVQQAQDTAVGRIMGYNQMNLGAASARTQANLGVTGAYGQVAGGYNSLANSAYQRYITEKQRGTFWSNLGKGLLSAAGTVASFALPGIGSAIGGVVAGKIGGAFGGGAAGPPGMNVGSNQAEPEFGAF